MDLSAVKAAGSSEGNKEFSGCIKCRFLSLLSEELLASQEELFHPPPSSSNADVITEVSEIKHYETVSCLQEF